MKPEPADEVLVDRISPRMHRQRTTLQHPLDRFMSRVQVDGNGCWRWKGRIDRYGYGAIGRRGAHRWIFIQCYGPMGEGMETDHLCRVRDCVRPTHLEAVTKYENWRRGMMSRFGTDAVTHCIHGHEFTPKNTYVRPDGHRTCRQCNTASARHYQHRKAKV